MNNDILDDPFGENEDNGFYSPWFQMVGIAFYFIPILLMPLVSSRYFWMGYFFIWFVFSIYKLLLEKKNKLVTNWGVFLNLILGYLIMVSILGFAYKTLSWPYGSEMLIVGLGSLPYLLVFLPLVLKDVSWSVKAGLAVAGLILSINFIVSIFVIENWTEAEEMLKMSQIIYITPLIFLFLYKTKSNRKENYYINWYASIAILQTIGTLISSF